MQIFILVIIVCFAAFIFIKKYGRSLFVVHHAPVTDQANQQKVVGYTKKFRIMNGSEAALFFELKKQFSEGFYVFPNMRIGDVLDSVNGPGFYKRRNKILPRHLDFVICNSSFSPVLAFELQGSSHNKMRRIEIDSEKREILEEANLPLVIIDVGNNFSEAVTEAKARFC